MLKFKNLVLVALALSLSACASYRPILDENEKYDSVGETRAEADIDYCMNRADRYLAKHKSEKTKKEMGRQALKGAAVGGLIGGLGGGNLSSAAGGAIVGAGVSAGATALGASMEDKLTPDQLKKQYVRNCLSRKNYQVIGWK